ncbi:MAG: AAA family ATPase [Deltaproteobacteria bacterium]|jgi:hypothetical protein|nr:AAA family ATPase [Deltaproteobacteria bacterium]
MPPDGPGAAPDLRERLRGRVARVLFLDGLTGEGRIVADAGSGAPVEARGPFGLPAVGESAELAGSFAPGPGPQVFLAEEVILTPPRDPEGLAAFLSAGYIEGLDTALARSLVRAFGAELLKILAEAPERLAGAPGLPPGAREAVISGAHFFLALKDLASALAPLGLGPVPAALLLKSLGRAESRPEGVQDVLTDPWKLASALRILGPSVFRRLAARQAVRQGGRPGPGQTARLSPEPTGRPSTDLSSGRPDSGLSNDRPGSGLSSGRPGTKQAALPSGPAILQQGWRIAGPRASAPPPGLWDRAQPLLAGEMAAVLHALRARGIPSVSERALSEAVAPPASGPGSLEGEAFKPVLDRLLVRGSLCLERPEGPACPDGRRVMLPESLAEIRAVERGLAALVAAPFPEAFPPEAQAVAFSEALCGFALDPGQREALRAVAGRKAALVIGPRGSGKKLLAALLREVFRDRGLPAALASVTRRGALELSLAAGAPAAAAEDLLEFSPEAGAYIRGPVNPFPPGLLAVCEAELLAPGQLARLLGALSPGSALALFADPWRLPPPEAAEAAFGRGAAGLRAAHEPETSPGLDVQEAPPSGIPRWLATLAEGKPEPAGQARRPAPGERLLRPAKLCGTYSPPGSDLLEALRLLREGKAHPGARSPRGDFFWLPGEDEAALAAKAAVLIRDRIPRKLGIPGKDASVVLTGPGGGPLGHRALSEAVHRAFRRELPPPLTLNGRDLRPGGRVLFSRDDPARRVLRGDRGLITRAGPQALEATIETEGRSLSYGPGLLPELLPAWALTAASAPPWARFPAAVVALGRGSERSLGRMGLFRAASLAERLLVITGPPGVYARVLASRAP